MLIHRVQQPDLIHTAPIAFPSISALSLISQLTPHQRQASPSQAEQISISTDLCVEAANGGHMLASLV